MTDPPPPSTALVIVSVIVAMVIGLGVIIELMPAVVVVQVAHGDRCA